LAFILRIAPKFIKTLIPKGTIAITLFPFILVYDNVHLSDETLIQHEKIHLRQQIEMGVFLFFIWYFLEFMYKLIIYKNFFWAYRNISFEREAYLFEENEIYLKNRKFWAFLKWLK
jgi:hypothetical protein